MKRRGKRLALLLSLGVLAGGWLLAEYMAGRLVISREEAAEAQEETILLSAGAASDIRALRWTYGEETVSLERDGDDWVNTRDRDCPIAPEKVTPLMEAVSSVTAGLAIQGVTDFSQYGLDEPQAVVAVTVADHQVIYEVGNETIAGENYLRLDGTNTVYTESGGLLAAFSLGLEELLAYEAPPEDIASVTAMTVTTAGSGYELTHREEREDVWYGGYYDWYAVTAQETMPLEESTAKALYQAVTDIHFIQCVDWHEENFAQYGIDAPQATAQVTYTAQDGTEKTFTLRFGDYRSGFVFVNILGSERVYLASGTALDGLMRPDWEAMTPLAVCPADGESLTGLVVDMGGHTYDIAIHTESRQEVDSHGNAVAETTRYYTANGWTLDAPSVEAWLENLFTLTGEGLARPAEGLETMLSVTFRFDSEAWPELALVLQGYDSTRCLCGVNGEQWYFLPRETAEALLAEAERFLILE